MGRPKKQAVTEVKKPRKDPRIQEVYEEEVTFTCPVRGLVKQKVKIKRFKPATEQESKHLVVSINELTEALDKKDDGLAIYSDGEELGVVTTPGDAE